MENKIKLTSNIISESEIKEINDYMEKLNEPPQIKKLTMEEIEENHKVNFVKDLERIEKYQKLTARQIDEAKKLNDEENLNKELKNLDEDIETSNKLNEFGEKESVYEYKLGRVNQPPDIRPRGYLNVGQSVKLTEHGKITLRYSNNVDILGVFYIENIFYKRSYDGSREVGYHISQGNQRLSFYDNYNICLEGLTHNEAVDLNKQRVQILHDQNAPKKERGDEAIKYQYASQYNSNSYYEYKYSEEDNENLRNWAKTATVKARYWDNPPEKPRRGHALTKIFR